MTSDPFKISSQAGNTVIATPIIISIMPNFTISFNVDDVSKEDRGFNAGKSSTAN